MSVQKVKTICIRRLSLHTMFGAFRSTASLSSGLLWYVLDPGNRAEELTNRKSPFRLSPTRKANLRKRLRRVDDVIAAVAESGVETRSLSRAIALPKEHEMEARGKRILWEEGHED